jgi:hypothetical protein
VKTEHSRAKVREVPVSPYDTLDFKRHLHSLPPANDWQYGYLTPSRLRWRFPQRTHKFGSLASVIEFLPDLRARRALPNIQRKFAIAVTETAKARRDEAGAAGYANATRDVAYSKLTRKRPRREPAGAFAFSFGYRFRSSLASDRWCLRPGRAGSGMRSISIGCLRGGLLRAIRARCQR